MNKQTNPPKWARRLLEWYAEPHVVEDLVGDLDEMFWKNLKSMSPLRAKWRYARQVIALVFSYAIKRRRDDVPERSYHSAAMYANYWKVAVRSLVRHRSYTLINVICLSVGMSVGLLALGAFVDILEVDDFHTNRSRIYRVITTLGEEKLLYASSSAPLGDKLKNEGTGIEEVVQLQRGFDPQVSVGPKLSVPLRGYYATSNFLSVFTFPLVEGKVSEALTRPFTVVITREAAHKLFGNGQAMGRTIEVEGVGDFEVTGIIDEYPRSHFYIEALASFATLEALESSGQRKPGLSDWGPITEYYTYLLLEEKGNLAEVEARVGKMAEFHEFKENAPVQYSLEALTDIPMGEHYKEIGMSWGYESLIVFFTLSLLVLLPACFNYANISVARAMKRAKEIGLRKVSGGEQRHIFYQMILETAIISLGSLMVAIPIYLVISGEFVSMIVHGSRTFDLEISPALFGLFVLFALITGIIAGAFPAFYFARLSPIDTLRNAPGPGKLSRISVRKWLVVVQFGLSMVFIMSVVIALKQYRFALNYDLGFQKENMLTIPLKDAKVELLRNQLMSVPGVQGVSFASSIPGSGGVSYDWAHLPDQMDSVLVAEMFIDRHYPEAMNMKLVAGTTFPENLTSGEKYIIVNEALVRKFKLGTPYEALGKVLTFEKNTELRIVGVVKDFNFAPLHDEILSFCFRSDPAKFRLATVRIAPVDFTEMLLQLEKKWNSLSEEKFEAQFLDDQLKGSLQGFLSMVKIFGFLGFVAITVSALGLLAIVISVAETRMREMGIRKVMGATPAQLASILSLGFFKLVGIGALVAVPLTYFMFDKVFLRMIFYRTPIELPEILLSILLLFGMVALVISSQTLRVARINPVDTLRSE